MMRKNYALIAVSDCVLLLFSGLVYSWSVFKKPLAGTFGWTDGQLTWTFTICMACFCLGGFMAAKITKKVKHNYVVIAAGVVIFLGFLSASQMTQLWQLYISYGVMVGFSVGAVYNCVLATGNAWYKGRAGMMSGLFLMCFGAGSLIFGPLSTVLMNSIGWRKTFIILGLLFLAVFAVTSFQVIMPLNSEMNIANKKASTKAFDVATRDMLKRADFWIYFAWSTLLSAVGLGFVGQVFTVSSSFGLTDMTSSYMVSLVAICNGIGRLCFGSIFDIKGRKLTMNLISVMTVLAASVLILAVSSNVTVLLYAAFILLGLGFGGITPTNSNFIRNYYGCANYSTNFSIINFNLLISVFIGQFVGSIIYMNTGGYFYPAIAMLVLSVFGAGFSTRLK